MKKNGFLGTFIYVCSGTEIFPELIKYSLLRVLWHLLILTVICGFVNVTLRLYPFNKSYEECCANLSKRFGKIEYTDKGIVPSIKPEDARSATSSNDFRVDYLTDISDLKSYTREKKLRYGIVWTPESIFAWINLYEEENWMIFPLLLPTHNIKTAPELLQIYKDATKAGALESSFYIFSKMYRISPDENKGKPAISFRDFKTNILFWIPVSIPSLYGLILFAYILLNCLLISPFYILLFTSFSYMFGRANMLEIKFFQLFIVGIYTGFPGLVIATLYNALALPGLDFQTVFLISYFVYSFAVFSRLREKQVK